MSKRKDPEIFPPITLDAGRPQWTPRDKLARLVSLSRSVGYGQEHALAGDLAEEWALFHELAALLEKAVLEPDHARALLVSYLQDGPTGADGCQHTWRERFLRLHPEVEEWLKEKTDG